MIPLITYLLPLGLSRLFPGSATIDCNVYPSPKSSTCILRVPLSFSLGNWYSHLDRVVQVVVNKGNRSVELFDTIHSQPVLAISRIELFGFFFDGLRHLVRPGVARLRSVRSAAIRVPTRRRFSIRAKRRMIGMAHNSPNFKKATGLVSSYETAETFRIDPPIAVRDDLQRDVVDARKPGRWAVRQARQFPAVPFREVSLGRANLFFEKLSSSHSPAGAIRRFALIAVVRRRRAQMRTSSFSARRFRSWSGARPKPSLCESARALP